MAIDFLYPQYEVVRNNDRCINCRACAKRCPYELDTPKLLRAALADGRVKMRSLPPLRGAVPDPCP